MPVKNATSHVGPVAPEILHPYSMNVKDAWGVVKIGTPGGQAFNCQPQITVTQKGTWLCCWTQANFESNPDQRVVCARSTDSGRNWGPEICIEPAGDDYRVPPELLDDFGLPI